MSNMKNIVFYHFLHSRAEEDDFGWLYGACRLHRGCEVVDIRDEPPNELKLFPWEITKVLTAGDLQFIPGLELGRKQVEEHILKHLNPETVSLMLLNRERIPIKIHDVDTKTGHHYASLGKCSNNNENFCLQGGWHKNFVHRRGLEAGMQIGVYWETRTSTLRFSVLNGIPRSSKTASRKDALSPE